MHRTVKRHQLRSNRLPSTQLTLDIASPNLWLATFNAGRSEAARISRGRSVRSLAVHHPDPEKAIYSGMYYKWLNGTSQPSQRKLGCLAEALEVPVAWLLGEGSDEVPGGKPSTTTLPTTTPRKPTAPAAVATGRLDKVLVVVPAPHLERLQALARIAGTPVTVATAKEALDYALASDYNC